MKLAAIDIGTNSVLLLIAEEKPDGSVIPLVEEANITRIGEGLSRNPIFSRAGMERTLNVLRKYKTLCDQNSVEKILVVGTAAFRKAQNSGDFVGQVERKYGMAIEIISGEREAALVWESARTDFGSDILVVDIGGGSTEIIVSEKEWVSLPIGSVFLTENFCHSDPVSDADYRSLFGAVQTELDSLKLKSKLAKELIATAGTATTLGAIHKGMRVYRHGEIHRLRLQLADLDGIINELKSKTIEERKKIPGLEPKRADVILAGSLLLEKIVRRFGFKEIIVSDRGVRWGLVYEALKTLRPATKTSRISP